MSAHPCSAPDHMSLGKQRARESLPTVIPQAHWQKMTGFLMTYSKASYCLSLPPGAAPACLLPTPAIWAGQLQVRVDCILHTLRNGPHKACEERPDSSSSSPHCPPPPSHVSYYCPGHPPMTSPVWRGCSPASICSLDKVGMVSPHSVDLKMTQGDTCKALSLGARHLVKVTRTEV